MSCCPRTIVLKLKGLFQQFNLEIDLLYFIKYYVTIDLYFIIPAYYSHISLFNPPSTLPDLSWPVIIS
jgi:hypothetical protein